MSSVRSPELPPQAETTTRDAGFLGTANRWLGVFLVTVLCITGLQFCLHIARSYIARLFDGNLEQWNNYLLPGLFDPDNPGATSSIGLHFVAGALVMVLGCIQLVNAVRRRWPRMHRWIGRIYVALAVLTALGGLGFIVLQGTIGGAVMNIGFGLYGILMVLAAAQTVRHARARQFHRHRAWAIRLFALVIGSWLYRLEYGFSGLLELGGRTADFRGWFDQVMSFFFYVPTLAVAELYLRSQRANSPVALRTVTFAALTVSCIVVLGGFYAHL